MRSIMFKNQPVHIQGPIPTTGNPAPRFTLVNEHLQDVTLESLGSTKKLLNVFVSLDTPVCSQSIHTFYEKMRSHQILLINISLDLPFAISRFCQNTTWGRTLTLSAFRSSFPDDYGIRIVDGVLEQLCARTVFVIDEHNIITYYELVPEITHEPNYQAALDTMISKT